MTATGDGSSTRSEGASDALGARLVKAAAGLFALAVLSLFALVVELLAAADEPFVDQPTIANPLSGWLALGCLTASGLSMLGYAVWSFRQQRRLRVASDRESYGPLGRLLGTFRALNSEPDDLDEYERRVKRTGVSLIVAGMLLALPLSLILSA